MHMRNLAVILLGSALFACGEPAEDAAAVYIAPVGCNCDANLYACGVVCEQGDYPEGTPFMVVYAIPRNAKEIHNEMCSVEQTGDFELTIHTAWREQDRFDDIAETYFECDDMTPPLAAGDWTIRAGDETGALRIPSTQTDAFMLRP
jgi:hypothetical protein